MNRKKLLYRAAALAVILAIAAVMFVIGRGHTVYLDNKSFDYNGKTYETPYKVVINVNGEQAAKLYDKERGSAISIGQNFRMELEVTETKGGASETVEKSITLPYSWDGVIINIPALLADLPQEVCMSEFIIVDDAPADEDVVTTDEFDMSSLEG